MGKQGGDHQLVSVSRFARLSMAALALAGAAGLPGCSHEHYSYASTAHMPLTVTMKNTTTSETVWSYDVPVGQQLNLTFQRDADLADSQGYDDMLWTVSDIGKSNSSRPSTLRVPPPSERRLDLTIRSGNEPRTTQVIESERANSNAAYPPVGPGLFPRTAAPNPDAAPQGTAPSRPGVAPGANSKSPAPSKSSEPAKAPPPAISLPDPKQQSPK